MQIETKLSYTKCVLDYCVKSKLLNFSTAHLATSCVMQLEKETTGDNNVMISLIGKIQVPFGDSVTKKQHMFKTNIQTLYGAMSEVNCVACERDLSLDGRSRNKSLIIVVDKNGET